MNWGPAWVLFVRERDRRLVCKQTTPIGSCIYRSSAGAPGPAPGPRGEGGRGPAVPSTAKTGRLYNCTRLLVMRASRVVKLFFFFLSKQNREKYLRASYFLTFKKKRRGRILNRVSGDQGQLLERVSFLCGHGYETTLHFQPRSAGACSPSRVRITACKVKYLMQTMPILQKYSLINFMTLQQHPYRSIIESQKHHVGSQVYAITQGLYWSMPMNIIHVIVITW